MMPKPKQCGKLCNYLEYLAGLLFRRRPSLGGPGFTRPLGLFLKARFTFLISFLLGISPPQVVGWCFLRGPGRVHWLVVPHVVLFQAAVPADPHNDLNLGVGYPVLRPQGRQGQVVRLAPIAFHQAIPVQGRRVLRPRAGPPPSGDGAG